MAVADDQREVLGEAAEHGSDEVGAERRCRRGGVAEPLGEHEVGEEDRRERQGDGDDEAGDRRQIEQGPAGHQPIERKGAEQGE